MQKKIIGWLYFVIRMLVVRNSYARCRNTSYELREARSADTRTRGATSERAMSLS
jgi:hypothetical protein